MTRPMPRIYCNATFTYAYRMRGRWFCVKCREPVKVAT